MTVNIVGQLDRQGKSENIVIQSKFMSYKGVGSLKKITGIHEISVPLEGDITNAVVNFSAHTVSLVVVVSNVVYVGWVVELVIIILAVVVLVKMDGG